MLKLMQGDLLYYESHRACGVLIERVESHGGVVEWKYNLRSPLRSDPSGPCVQNIYYREESALVEGVESGRLKLFRI